MSNLSSGTINTGRATRFDTFTVSLQPNTPRVLPLYLNSGALHGPLRVRVAQMVYDLCPDGNDPYHLLTSPVFGVGFNEVVPTVRAISSNALETVPLNSYNSNIHTFVSPYKGPIRLTNVTEFIIPDNTFKLWLDKSPADISMYITFTFEYLQEKFVT